ncbi:5-formyltetrahydrofolate cyclo-ligase [Neolecta irregularis DAH-3]|uniref:5-formyltetrahydrofolate cyclo-ligase n=1 Tax=Neolecta irregularis (strain DAH-3) TaxID=1198029 RepID=A0A1U7LNV8_NEOID|nr:5-formyltetrahydrofolate cyclo-ligase [Neolecta irregularis DAH-3]|eukprot:OLL24334.1 5-formyltetrahydrofolate cyclo-ligase [Neolecta irregularis DAH-3]
MEKELQTLGIIERLFSMGKKVYVPHITGDYMKMVPLYSSDLQHLKRDKLGIPVLPTREAVQPHILDLIIVPGLGFDIDCGRLGYGKGYYDRYFSLILEECQNWGKRKPAFVGVGLLEQIVDEVPMEATDWRLDGLIIGDGRLHSRDPLAPITDTR